LESSRKRTSAVGQKTTLEVPSCPSYLPLVRAIVNHLGELGGLDAPTAKAVVLAVDEAVTNIIKYGYEGDYQQKIIMTTRFSSDRIEITIRDFGKKTPPEQIRSRHLDDIKPGGLGVFLIKEIMDEVAYTPCEDAGMELRLVKYLSES